MQTGLIKKATVVGIDGAETEARMVEALGSHSVQLVELKLVSVAFSGTMGNLKWLAASAEHLAPTLKVLIVKKCGVKGPIPLEVGEFSHLAELALNDNKLDGGCMIHHTGLPSKLQLFFFLTGELPLSVIKMKTQGVQINLSDNTGFTLPTNIGDLGDITKLDLSRCSLTGGV
jgi:hypothetical protein